MNKENFFRVRGLMSVVLGVAASVLFYICLYLMLSGKASPDNILCDVMLMFFVVMVGPNIAMFFRSPFPDRKYTRKYIFINVIESIIVGLVGFQMLTRVLRAEGLIESILAIMALYNVLYLAFQIRAFGRLER